MRTSTQINDLLHKLAQTPACDLEAQDLDFKEWDSSSMDHSVRLAIKMAVCMANGGGGTVVFGVNDKATGRDRAILGVPPEVDVNRLKKAIYDRTDPRLMPVIEEMRVPEGTGRLLLMQVHPGLPPYTDTAGHGIIRVGCDCQPLTGTLRSGLMVETGENDYTAVQVSGSTKGLVSASAMEHLRNAARKEKAPDELLRMSDCDLLSNLGLIRSGKLIRAGVILAGSERALHEHVAGLSWTHLRMETDTRYSDRADGVDAIPVALARMLDRINADNPITTIEHGMFHFEYRAYPELALREALMNALSHADFRLAAPIMVKQFPDRLEMSNPGGFVGGIRPENILHHPPIPRNPALVDALAKLRLVNRSNLGIGRMFESFLVDGREPPQIREAGNAVVVVFRKQAFSSTFRSFVAEENRNGRMLGVDILLLLQYLLRHAEVNTTTGAQLCQRDDASVREILSRMETEFGYLERGGPSGRGTYWTLRSEVHRRVAAAGHPERDRRIDWESAKTRVLSVLRQRAEHGESGLSNAEIRKITRLDRNQVFRLMNELQMENPELKPPGRGRYARYTMKQGNGAMLDQH